MGRVIYRKLRDMLSQKGWTSYSVKRDKIIGQATWKKLQEDGDVDTRTIAILCDKLDCQPGDIMEYVKEDKSEH